MLGQKKSCLERINANLQLGSQGKFPLLQIGTLTFNGMPTMFLKIHKIQKVPIVPNCNLNFSRVPQKMFLLFQIVALNSYGTLVNCPTRWSLSFIFVFLCWSSSWRLGPHIDGGRLLWPLLEAGMTVLTQFFCKMYFLYVPRCCKKKFLWVLQPEFCKNCGACGNDYLL